MDAKTYNSIFDILVYTLQHTLDPSVVDLQTILWFIKTFLMLFGGHKQVVIFQHNLVTLQALYIVPLHNLQVIKPDGCQNGEYNSLAPRQKQPLKRGVL